MDASSTDGRRAVVSRGRRFAVVDLDTGEARTPASLTAGARGALTSSRGGDRVAVAHDDGAVAVLRADTLSPEVTFELGPPPCGLAFAPDGRRLAGTGWGGGVQLTPIGADLWSRMACERLRPLPLAPPESACPAPENGRATTSRP